MATALALGVGYSLFVLIFYVTSWRAFCRILSSRTDWSKTRRNAEFLSELEPSAQPVPAGGLQMIKEMMGEDS